MGVREADLAVNGHQEWKTLFHWFMRGKIPPQIFDHINAKCKHCGHEIIANENLTQHKCSNPMCGYHAKHRAAKLLHELGFKNIGPETCGRYLSLMDTSNHFLVLDAVLKRHNLEKPYVELWEVAKFATIPGISTGWQKVLAGYKSFEAFFGDNTNPDARKYMKYKDYLIEAESHFRIKPPRCRDVIWKVMIHGRLSGYKSRNLFISQCNDIVGQYINIELHTSAILSADYLITEFPDDDSYEKVRKAKDRSSRCAIVSPTEFVALLNQELELQLAAAKKQAELVAKEVKGEVDYEFNNM